MNPKIWKVDVELFEGKLDEPVYVKAVDRKAAFQILNYKFGSESIKNLSMEEYKGDALPDDVLTGPSAAEEFGTDDADKRTSVAHEFVAYDDEEEDEEFDDDEDEDEDDEDDNR